MHMKWRIYALWIVIAEAVGALSGWLTRSGVADYTANALKPPLTPPGVVFPNSLGDTVRADGYCGSAGYSWLAAARRARGR